MQVSDKRRLSRDRDNVWDPIHTAGGMADPASPAGPSADAADLASTGAMGQHSSSFDEPRLGIGNVAELLTGSRQPGDLAAFLGFSCP